jgi:hypothetical protein
MAKKLFSYKVLSNQLCSTSGCTKRIKLNVLVRKQKKEGLVCYKCYQKNKQKKQEENF